MAEQNKVDHKSGIFAVIVVAILGFVFFKACLSSDPSSSKEKDLTATIGVGVYELAITNTSSNNYTSLRIKINDDYVYEASGLSSFETKKIPYEEFAKSDGTRFLPSLVKINNIYISGNYLGESYWAFFEPKK